MKISCTNTPCTHTHSHSQQQTHIHKYKHIYTNTNTYTQIQTHIHKHKHIYTNTNAGGPALPPLVTVAPSDKQMELLTVLQWQLQWKPCPTMFLHNFGHRRPPNDNEIFHGSEGLQITMQAGEVSYYNRGWQHAVSTLFMYCRIWLN